MIGENWGLLFGQDHAAQKSMIGEKWDLLFGQDHATRKA